MDSAKKYDLLNVGFDKEGNVLFDIRVVVPRDKCTPELKADLYYANLGRSHPLYNFQVSILPDDVVGIVKTVKENMSAEEITVLFNMTVPVKEVKSPENK